MMETSSDWCQALRVEKPQGRDRARRSLVLIALLVLAACSSDGGGASPSPTGSSTLGSETASESPTPSPSEQPPDLTSARFETPSGNILCESSSSSLLCIIDSGLVPEPSHDFCPVDWIGVFIQTGQYAGPACSGDPGISREPAEVLDYGLTWALEGVSCLSESTGLTCEDESGNGFTLARAGWSLLGKGKAATAAFHELRAMVRKQALIDLPGQVSAVPVPVLRAGDDCGELQEAFVPTELNDGGTAIYTACYVSGTWNIASGPLYPD
jgi:hypothetical protein